MGYFFILNPNYNGEFPWWLTCWIETFIVSFEHYSHYVHFSFNTLRKSVNSLIHSAMGIVSLLFYKDDFGIK